MGQHSSKFFKFFAIALWVLLFGFTGITRYYDLGSRPLHADEATGARLVAKAVEGDGFRFDPQHYHGPLFHRVAQLTARSCEMQKWSQMRIVPLRAITATAGVLLCAVPLIGIRRFGNFTMFFAACFLSFSPLLAYYERMFIHESLLALFGVGVLFQLAIGRRLWPLGIWLGLMFATKETVAISVIAWLGAGFFTYLLSGLSRNQAVEFVKNKYKEIIAIPLLAALIGMAFYTNGFRYWQGAVDAVRTYFVYDLVAGHDKPFYYFLEFLLMPKRLANVLWWEGGIFVFAGITATASFVPRALPKQIRSIVHFLTFSFLIHLLIYSLIQYKTPWTILLPWIHVCLLGGFFFSLRPLQKIVPSVLSGLITTAFLTWLALQTYKACFLYPSESRNRYAYVPTSSELPSVNKLLDDIAAAYPEFSLEPIGVIGSNYWPLPWYLRQYEKVGYWQNAPDSLERLPIIFATHDISDILAETHVPLPYGLRDAVPMTIWVRNDFWSHYLDSSE